MIAWNAASLACHIKFVSKGILIAKSEQKSIAAIFFIMANERKKIYPKISVLWRTSGKQ